MKATLSILWLFLVSTVTSRQSSELSRRSRFPIPKPALALPSGPKDLNLATTHNDLRQSTTNALSARGGASNIASKFIEFVGATKLRCWIVLFVAILDEVVSTTILTLALKEKSAGKLAVAVSLYVVSLLLFASSLMKIDVSIAYAVWSAVGTALVSAVGILHFGEKADPLKIGCIGLIILGVIGLNLKDSVH